MLKFLVCLSLANPWEVEMDQNVEKLDWLVEVMEDLVFSDVFLPDQRNRIMQNIFYVND